ncbi:hypothetical protein HYW83_01825 [Candidatus Peregrinibacteria bacterium]|nr:hypothetical protein [Candidatus Peregrinibacteria bacterium]
MITKFVGMKEFRANISAYTEQAKTMDIHFVVLRKNVPVLEIKPIDEKRFVLQKFAKEIKKARTEIKKGKTFTQNEIMKEFGLL